MSYPHNTRECADYHQLVRDFGDDRPTIVVLCGSTRFRDDFDAMNRDLTRAGAMVLAPGVFVHAGDTVTEEDKARLDELHLRKIELADEVYVVNPGGYIGASTRKEIAYAEDLGRPVSYLTDIRTT